MIRATPGTNLIRKLSLRKSPFAILWCTFCVFGFYFTQLVFVFDGETPISSLGRPLLPGCLGIHDHSRYKQKTRIQFPFKSGHRSLGSGRWRWTEAGSYLRLIDSCITQPMAHGPSRTCNESNEEEPGRGGGGGQQRRQPDATAPYMWP